MDPSPSKITKSPQKSLRASSKQNRPRTQNNTPGKSSRWKQVRNLSKSLTHPYISLRLICHTCHCPIWSHIRRRIILGFVPNILWRMEGYLGTKIISVDIVSLLRPRVIQLSIVVKLWALFIRVHVDSEFGGCVGIALKTSGFGEEFDAGVGRIAMVQTMFSPRCRDTSSTTRLAWWYNVVIGADEYPSANGLLFCSISTYNSVWPGCICRG